MDHKNNGNAIVFKQKKKPTKKYIEIISLVKQMILKGEIKPGDRLPTEAQLTEQLGISRTSVREALKILESMGVILIKRGEGMFLQRPLAGTEFNPLIFDLLMMSNETDRLIEFRQYFEHMVIEIAVANREPMDCEKLRQYIEEQEKQINSADDTSWIELDIGFHLMILELTRNPFMIDIGKTVYELYRNLKPQVIYSEDRNNTIATHNLYLELICSPKPQLFEQLRAKIRANYSAIKFS
ncbi:GntR family transcriptional regulator [Marispirochaeta aestuarii]|uniref:FadR/GntR family transcriptional regulator n=1 Tax=Marispirochaeta aestuarii TaxID=1963862 RepID=UPI002ABD6CBD|nr:GntR family transcriptional regulator [Marispirochaeta aestuarii]